MSDNPLNSTHYKFNHNVKSQPQLPENAIEIDLDSKLLKITIVTVNEHYTYYQNRFSSETLVFPLIRYLTCDKCGELITVFAKGMIENDKYESLFSEPWEKSDFWKIIKANGAFGLIADKGHRFRLDTNNILIPTCKGRTTNKPVICLF